MLRLLKVLLCSVLLSAINCEGQIVKLKAVKSAFGYKTETYRYKYRDYVNDSDIVIINLNDSTVQYKNNQYYIIEMPRHWSIHAKNKSCTFMCYDLNYDKVFLKLTRFDKYNKSSILIYTKNYAYKVLGFE